MSTPFVAFDWDGVLHKCRSYHPSPFTEVDLAPVHAALRLGWRVQIMTANDDLRGIARALNRETISAYVDAGMRFRDWPESRQGIVVISQRKMWTDFLVDDRAIQYHYGTGTDHLTRVLEGTIEAERQERELRKAGV